MKTKSLFIAICLLVVSATMLGTASFAWFSMNTEVAVDGIEVEAYSDSLFLEISKEKADNYNTSVSFAGEKEYLSWLERQDKGVPVGEAIQKEFIALRDECGLTYKFPFEN